MNTPDRRAVIAALINNDPELLRLADSSATFARGLDQIVDAAATAVAGLAVHAVEVDRDIDARIRAAHAAGVLKIGPIPGLDPAASGVSAATGAATRRAILLDEGRRAALHDGHGDEGRCRSMAIDVDRAIRCTRPRGHNDGVTGTAVHAHADRLGLTWFDDEEAGRA